MTQPPVQLTPEELESITRRTLAHYDRNAQAFWEGTRDYDVSQNIDALLKHIDGRTKNIPVVLLYPGKREDQNGLSFMCELPADRDYRPRIYP